MVNVLLKKPNYASPFCSAHKKIQRHSGRGRFCTRVLNRKTLKEYHFYNYFYLRHPVTTSRLASVTVTGRCVGGNVSECVHCRFFQVSSFPGRLAQTMWGSGQEHNSRVNK